jgi:AcrR family transcriptional regulator
VNATAELLMTSGWDAVTHAEVAKRAGYSRATVYAHWPARLDLIRDSIDHLCNESSHPATTGDLRGDLIASLSDFASDLSEGGLDRLLAGVIERSDREEVTDLRLRLYETGTRGLRSVLATHLETSDVEPTLALLTGAVMVRVSYEGKPAPPSYITDLIERALSGATWREPTHPD